MPSLRPSLRILIILPGTGIGGITTGLLGVLRHVNRKKFQITTAVSSRNETYKLFRKEKIPCLLLPKKKKIPFLSHFIKKNRIDIVQTCDASIEGALAAIHANVRLVWYFGSHPNRAFSSPSLKMSLLIQDMAQRASDAVVVQSIALAKDAFLNIPKKKLHIIPWGVDLPASAKPERHGWLKQKLKIPSHVPLVAMVANFYPAKRHLDFLRSIPLILKKIPDARFVIAGQVVGNSPHARRISSRYKQCVIKSIQKMKFDHRVILTEFTINRRNAWYSEVDLLVIPSYEGMCQAMLEAGLRGVPVVAANVGGVRDVIQHKRSGLLVPYRKCHEIAQAVSHLLKNQKTRRKLGRTLQKKILKNFLAQRQVKQFEKLYGLLANRSNTLCNNL